MKDDYKDPNDRYNEYTYGEKVARLYEFKDHPEFKRFYNGMVRWYPLLDEDDDIEQVNALFEVLMWRLSKAEDS